MIPRFVFAVVIAAVSGVGAAQDLPEFAPADLVLTKRLLVRHKVAELAFLKKDRGLVALANPPAVLQWSAHNRAPDSVQMVEPWAFANRTPIVMAGPTWGHSFVLRPEAPEAEHVALRRPSLQLPARAACRRRQVGWVPEDLTRAPGSTTFRSDGRRR